MPFKLKLKKSRQYNVVTKNFFIISVELLDNTVVECTLSAESTGKDCLGNVCQKLGLHQPEFFGLRYFAKRLRFQWVDLSKPLKKQLDKYAQETYLYLGVMFYIGDVSRLQDEMTRYQYFLQVKTDIVENRLLCSQEAAVQLASYSLQAEFGDHDRERHTAEYLKGFVLLPKYMTNVETTLEALIEEVVLAHRNLQSMSPAAAEIYYIMKAQQLEGYGQEHFSAKDEMGSELEVGVSLVGMIVKNKTSQTSDCYEWSDITDLTFHKRIFSVQCEKLGQAIQLQLEDAAAAKYIWRVCVQQHRLYVRNKTENPTVVDASTEKQHFSFLDNRRSHSQVSIKDMSGSSGTMQLKYTEETMTSIVPPEQLNETPPVTFTLGSQMSLPTCTDSAYSINSASHSSITGLGQNVISNSSLSLPSVQMNNPQLRSMLPSYRTAPDYETAIQRKYGVHSASLGSIPAPHIIPHDENMGFLQQDITMLHPTQYRTYSHYKNFMDLANLDADLHHHPPYCVEGLGNGAALRNKMSAISNLTLPPTHTYSTPELTSQKLILTNNFVNSSIVQHQFKPPPPYPYAQCSSASTPDLASQALGADHHSNSSPDLALRHQISSAMGHANNVVMQENNTSEINPNENVHSPLVAANLCSNVGVIVPKVRSSSLVASNVPPSALNNSSLPQPASSTECYGGANFMVGGGRSRASSTQSAPEMLISTPFETGVVTTNQSSEQVNGANINSNNSQVVPVPSLVGHSRTEQTCSVYEKKIATKESRKMGPMMIAAMNGLTLSRPDLVLQKNDESRAPKDNRRQLLESKLAEGLVFIEFEQVLKKRLNADHMTAKLPENSFRNRFKDVHPYEDNRVCIAPSKENKTGYINASHITVTVGQQQRFYIAAQGPLSQTVKTFWQMVWEQQAQVIVMLTEIQEQGKDKCFLYWPVNNNKLEFGDYIVTKKFSTQSPSYITSSLILQHIPSKKQRIVWHIQYTDWPDHGCPEDIHGFLNFMEELDSVRRHAVGDLPKGKGSNVPMVVHCSAGVGRSGVTILTDIMLYSLDHNESIDLPRMLAHLRQQRMLIVQTVAQYKFVYMVLIQYLKNSRLI